MPVPDTDRQAPLTSEPVKETADHDVLEKDVMIHHDPPRGTSIEEESLADEEVEPENAPKLEKFKK